VARDVAVTADGNRLATVGEDGQLRLWSCEANELVAVRSIETDDLLSQVSFGSSRPLPQRQAGVWDGVFTQRALQVAASPSSASSVHSWLSLQLAAVGHWSFGLLLSQASPLSSMPLPQRQVGELDGVCVHSSVQVAASPV